jgi:hypothetical protein
LTTRQPDPDQSFNHLGEPEDGPERFISVNGRPSAEYQRWVRRKQREKLAKQKMQRLAVAKPHRPSALCVQCGDSFYLVGDALLDDHGLCAVCTVELQFADEIRTQLEDIHP